LPCLQEAKNEIVRLTAEIAEADASYDTPQCETSNQNETTDLPAEPISEKKTLASLVTRRTRPEQNVLTTEPKIRQELDFYLQLHANQSSNVLCWWGSHRVELPYLAGLAKFVLTSNATSVASERLFSLSGHIVSKKRNALKPSMVYTLVLLIFIRE